MNGRSILQLVIFMVVNAELHHWELHFHELWVHIFKFYFSICVYLILYTMKKKLLLESLCLRIKGFLFKRSLVFYILYNTYPYCISDLLFFRYWTQIDNGRSYYQLTLPNHILCIPDPSIWKCILLGSIWLWSFLILGEKGNFARSRWITAVPESFITDGSSGFYGFSS